MTFRNISADGPVTADPGLGPFIRDRNRLVKEKEFTPSHRWHARKLSGATYKRMPGSFSGNLPTAPLGLSLFITEVPLMEDFGRDNRSVFPQVSCLRSGIPHLPKEIFLHCTAGGRERNRQNTAGCL